MRRRRSRQAARIIHHEYDRSKYFFGAGAGRYQALSKRDRRRCQPRHGRAPPRAGGRAPRVIGGALWGRIGGFVSGIVNAVVSWFTGKDVGDHIYAALFGKPGESGDGTAVARAANPPAVLSERPPSTAA